MGLIVLGMGILTILVLMGKDLSVVVKLVILLISTILILSGNEGERPK